MSNLPVSLFSSADVRRIDQHAISCSDTTGLTLMQRAADAAFAHTIDRFPDARDWLVLTGAGNNAGDGYLVALAARSAGLNASVTAVSAPERLQGDAAKARDLFLAAGGNVQRWSGTLAAAADLVIDAMLGIGLDRELSGDFRCAAETLNNSALPVHSLDIPSGIHADSGDVMGVAVKADLTTTFVRLKAGLFLRAGRHMAGELRFTDLGITDNAGCNAVMRRIVSSRDHALLAPRPIDAHKGNFGHVLVVGGGVGMPGAARLCAEAALRSGAGRVSVATHPHNLAAMLAARPELMVHAVSDGHALVDALNGIDVVAFGPGLGRDKWARQLYDVLADDVRPAVWDADALRLLAESAFTSATRIITPHPGEAAALLETSSQDVQQNRVRAVQRLAERYGGVAVLKGAGSLVADEHSVPQLSSAGNPGMATAGMGDVLTGIVSAFCAQGAALADAAALGVQVHAEAGDRAAKAGQRGMISTDVIDAIREVING